ncbi:MAG: hypothetical protein U0136_01435 [Bdellovibrionota bacterium]
MMKSAPPNASSGRGDRNDYIRLRLSNAGLGLARAGAKQACEEAAQPAVLTIFVSF